MHYFIDVVLQEQMGCILLEHLQKAILLEHLLEHYKNLMMYGSYSFFCTVF